MTLFFNSELGIGSIVSLKQVQFRNLKSVANAIGVSMSLGIVGDSDIFTSIDESIFVGET